MQWCAWGCFCWHSQGSSLGAPWTYLFSPSLAEPGWGKPQWLSGHSQGLNLNPRDLMHTHSDFRSGQESATDTRRSPQPRLWSWLPSSSDLATVCTHSFLCYYSMRDKRVSSLNLLWDGTGISPSTQAVLGVWKCLQIPSAETTSLRIMFPAIKHGRGKQPIILYYFGFQYMLNQS